MKDDLISRQDAKVAMRKLKKWYVVCEEHTQKNIGLRYDDVMFTLEQLPSAQPEKMQLSKEDATKDTTFDCISRQAAIDVLSQYPFEKVVNCISIIEELPSAQPESRREWYMKGYRDAQNAAMHESCTDCPLYDHDRHNCPRFNKVIPRAIEEVKPRWIPCEERLPEEQDEYLVTWVTKLHTGKRFVGIGIFEYDLSEDNWIFDDYMNAYIDVTVTAWMPLPPSYKGDEDERKCI